MKERFNVVYSDGSWLKKSVGSNTGATVYRNKGEAVLEARKIARDGAMVIIYGVNGEIKDVLGAGDSDDLSIKVAPVKHRMRNRDVNIAIAKALDENHSQTTEGELTCQQA